ncbi:sulfurtransferase complex subunit TusD [Paraglaciecola hydrolytica]|uniref:Multidrug transporter n=1 Tax=Paraglaciecola hydrolytica TaxID=1799789 RepID=A0A136A128_9ALTE|nr:sulfurtransferase complex subunit TusD [Paraglaciecola hydrolytica]KXI28948.1 multidrug transporter [Paraglaciecola hydrolytica]
MANIGILVMSSPSASQNASSALRLAQTIATSEHNLLGVFFYQDGVHNANQLQVSASNELNLYAAWTQLATIHACPLLVCVTAASKRGVLSQLDASENDSEHFNLSAPFQSVGLGELAQLIRNSDRLVQF